MESKITDYQYFAADMQLSEPHFDEEATVLSARPVVPLGDLPQQQRSGKGLAFSLAIVVAIMAGALAATLLYQRSSEKQESAIGDKGTTTPERVASDGQPQSGAGGAISDSNSRAASENAALTRTHNSAPVVEIKKAVPEVRKSLVYSRTAGSERVNETPQDAVGNQQDEWELRRAERMEERRLRREARHETWKETREQKRRSADDLLRIREIFEGSPRP